VPSCAPSSTATATHPETPAALNGTERRSGSGWGRAPRKTACDLDLGGRALASPTCGRKPPPHHAHHPHPAKPLCVVVRRVTAPHGDAGSDQAGDQASPKEEGPCRPFKLAQLTAVCTHAAPIRLRACRTVCAARDVASVGRFRTGRRKSTRKRRDKRPAEVGQGSARRDETRSGSMRSTPSLIAANAASPQREQKPTSVPPLASHAPDSWSPMDRNIQKGAKDRLLVTLIYVRGSTPFAGSADS